MHPLNHKLTTDLLRRYGSPLFVIKEEALHRQVALLRDNLPGIDLFYSMKANPSPFIVSTLVQSSLGIEVASQAELRVVLGLGVAPKHVFFTAPGKTREDLSLALETDILAINVDNAQELKEIRCLAAVRERPARITFRVHQRLASNSAKTRMSGQATQFGMEREAILQAVNDLKSDPSVEVVGLHTFFGSRVFDHADYDESFRQLFALAVEAEAAYGSPFQFLGMGGGFGYDATDRERLDLGALREVVHRHLVDNTVFVRNKRLMMESGNFLACPSSSYLTTVLYTKECLGVTFVIVDGGTHHRRPESAFSMMFSSGQDVRFLPERAGSTVDLRVVGRLCDPNDVLSYKVNGPVPEQGDAVVYSDSGSYSLTARNALFLSHDRPAEVAITANGVVKLTRRRRLALEEFDLDLSSERIAQSWHERPIVADKSGA